MGMAAMSSTQSKHVNVGDDARHSISLLCNGGGTSHGCRSLMRGVGAVGCPSGAVGTGGAHVVNGGDAVGMGGLCCGVHGWGEVGMACWGLFLGCGDSGALGWPFPACVCHCSMGHCQGLLQGLVLRWLERGELMAQLGIWQGVVVVGFWGSVSSVAELGMVLVSSVMWQQASKALATLWMALGSSRVHALCSHGFPMVVCPCLWGPLFVWL